MHGMGARVGTVYVAVLLLARACRAGACLPLSSGGAIWSLQSKGNLWETPQEIAPGVFLMQPRITVTADYGDHVIEIEVEMTPAGMRATKVTATADGQPVTAAMLRIPLGKMVRDAVLSMALPGESRQHGGDTEIILRSPLTNEQAELARLRGPADTTLAWVAHFYTLARAVGLPAVPSTCRPSSA